MYTVHMTSIAMVYGRYDIYVYVHRIYACMTVYTQYTCIYTYDDGNTVHMYVCMHTVRTASIAKMYGRYDIDLYAHIIYVHKIYVHRIYGHTCIYMYDDGHTVHMYVCTQFI